MDKDILAPEVVLEVKEVREALKVIPAEMKIDIAKNMALMDAIYKIGVMEGINRGRSSPPGKKTA